jgi:uncharacterized protein (DUF302 family)
MAEALGFELEMNLPYEQAVESVTAALKTQGFGILTRIDVKATLKEKLGVDFRPYAILGACNPPLAHQALSLAPEAGLLLPCNVTVEECGPGQSLVRIANPGMMVQAVERPDSGMAAVAAAATEKILKVIAVLKAA